MFDVIISGINIYNGISTIDFLIESTEYILDINYYFCAL